jgi:hypothetical protein
MRKLLHSIPLALAIVALVGSGFATAATDNPLAGLEARVAEAKSGKTTEYAPEALKEALAALTAAQGAAAGKDKKLALQAQEKTTLLLDVAEARAAERELLEKVAVQRVDLKKLEAELERNLQGEDKP